jgi:predicted permease
MYPPISDRDGAWTQNVAVDGNPVADEPGRATVYFNAVSPGYFATVGTPLVGGRDFSSNDSDQAPRVAIVNESLARRFFPGQPPLDRLITIGRNANRRDLRIVGVVRDAKYRRLQEQPVSVAYLPHAQQPAGNLFAELRLASPAAAAEDVRRVIRSLDPAVPAAIETVSDRIRQSLVAERVLALLASVLGAAALTIACSGIYGLLAFAVARQTKEIGLRLALGADRGRVLRMVMRETVALAAFGTAAGACAALWLGQFARGFLFQVSPRDATSILTAVAVMIAVAILAGLIPAYRAARVDPAVALRTD